MLTRPKRTKQGWPNTLLDVREYKQGVRIVMKNGSNYLCRQYVTQDEDWITVAYGSEEVMIRVSEISSVEVL